MLRECVILKNRPYFGGKESKKQVRTLSEIQLYENLILFNVYAGISSLLHVVSYPVQLNGNWYAYFEEIGTCRRNYAKRMVLSGVSVVPCNDGTWETEWCLLKTRASSIKRIYVKTSKYQPQYY